MENRANVGVISLGCSKNRVDSEVMLGVLADAGYALVNEPGDARVLIVNTCGFIEAAKQESIDTILEMAEYKSAGTCDALIVTGCLSKRYLDELSKELPEVDGFIGVSEYPSIASVVEACLSGKRVIGWEASSLALPMGRRILTTPGTYAYVKIAEGCDNCCSYCAIPSIRGSYVSRAPEDIIAECEALSGEVDELILVAQDTTRYAQDLGGGASLALLLKRLCGIEKLRRLRVLYSYPEAVDDQLLEVMAAEPKICRYLDIPLQHIDDGILSAMNRRTSREQIIALYNKVRGMSVDFALRTSLIAGFPGESVAQFEALLAFIEEYPFEHVGVFAYSAEEGTPAAELSGMLPMDVREARRDALMQVQQRVQSKLKEREFGKRVEVLIERDLGAGRYFGRSEFQAPEADGGIILTANGIAISSGDFVNVRLTGADGYDFLGVME